MTRRNESKKATYSLVGAGPYGSGAVEMANAGVATPGQRSAVGRTLFAVLPATGARSNVNTRHPAIIAIASVVGIALIVLAIVYWAEPAGSLPSWIPGHEAGSGHHHVKHGIAAFLVGVALLIFAWFQTGKRGPASDEAA
jgi:hypothetical protein